MNHYIGTKQVTAKPMTRQEYNGYRGWTLPADENGTDDSYLVEYLDGGKPNHPALLAISVGAPRPSLMRHTDPPPA